MEAMLRRRLGADLCNGAHLTLLHSVGELGLLPREILNAAISQLAETTIASRSPRRCTSWASRCRSF